MCHPLRPRSSILVTSKCKYDALPESEDESDGDGDGEEKNKLEEEEEADWERSVDLGVALMDGRYGDILGKIERHETSLMNALTKTLQTLLVLQHNRANSKGDSAKLKVIALPPAA